MIGKIYWKVLLYLQYSLEQKQFLLLKVKSRNCRLMKLGILRILRIQEDIRGTKICTKLHTARRDRLIFNEDKDSEGPSPVHKKLTPGVK